MIVNWLLTRLCNRSCSFCGIVHDPKNPGLKRIKDITKNELDFDTILSSLKVMNETYDPKTLFHIFYGGEPFIKKGFPEFLKSVNEMGNVMYTVITNGSMIDKIIETGKMIGKYKGLTVSLDPMIMSSNAKSINEIKNNNAVEVLHANRVYGLTDDMVIECMFDANNIMYASQFFEMMNNDFPEVSISVSVYDYPKNREYDFALNDEATPEYIKQMRLSPYAKSMLELRTLIQSGRYNIHMGKNKKFVDTVISTSDSTYFCGIARALPPTRIVDFKTLTIDADGEFRLCLRIAGRSNRYVQNVFKANTDIKASLFDLYQILINMDNALCQGCAWTCPMMDDAWDGQTIVSHDQTIVQS